jgi:hypothetical protein
MKTHVPTPEPLERKNVSGVSGSRRRNSFVLEVFSTFTRSWTWLIFGPVFAGLCGYGLASVRPVYYASSATLQMGDAAVRSAESLILSPAVLNNVVAAYPNLPGETLGAKRRNLVRRISWSQTPGESRKTANLFYLLVEGESPAQAQSIANMLLDRWLELTKPRPDAKSRLEFELERTELRLREADAMFDRMTGETKTLLAPNSLQGELATSIERLRESRFGLAQQAQKIRLELMGGSRDVVLTPPDLPTEINSLGRGAIAASFAAAAFLLILLLILMRHWLWAVLAERGQS